MYIYNIHVNIQVYNKKLFKVKKEFYCSFFTINLISIKAILQR